MEFKGQEGLKLLLQKGIDFELWDQKFADSRLGLRTSSRTQRSRSRWLQATCVQVNPVLAPCNACSWPRTTPLRPPTCPLPTPQHTPAIPPLPPLAGASRVTR